MNKSINEFSNDCDAMLPDWCRQHHGKCQRRCHSCRQHHSTQVTWLMFSLSVVTELAYEQQHVRQLLTIIIIIIINEFHRDTSLNETSTSMLPVVCVAAWSTGAVRSSVHSWMLPVTTVTKSLAAAYSRLLQRRRGRHDRRWSCATTVCAVVRTA